MGDIGVGVADIARAVMTARVAEAAPQDQGQFLAGMGVVGN